MVPEGMVPASDAKGTIHSDSDNVENRPGTVEPREVNHGRRRRRNLTRKGRLPSTYDSGHGAFAVPKPRRPPGCSYSIRPPTALSPQHPFRQDVVEECKKEVLAPAAYTARNINTDSHVDENKPGPVEPAHAVHDQARMRTLREKGKLPPSADSSPGAFAVQKRRRPHGYGRLRPTATLSPRLFLLGEEEFRKEASAKASDAERKIYRDSQIVKNGPDTVEAHGVQGQESSRNLRNKGRLPPSSDSSPGAFPIQNLRASHGSRCPRPPTAVTPPEPFILDEEECKEEVVEPAAEPEDSIDSNSIVVENIPDTVEAYAVSQDQEDIGEPVYAEILTETPKKWRERPLCRATFVGSCLFLVGVVVLVMYLTKVIGGTPPTSTLTPTITPVTPEEIACQFIEQPSLSDCRSVRSFDRLVGDSPNGYTIPSEIGFLTQLTRLGLDQSSLTGSIPPSLSNLTQLTSLSFEYNQLTGSIPPSLSNLTLLTSLSFSGNYLIGSIPPSLSNLTQLQELSFEYNQLTGSIPPSLSTLTLLTSLSFSFNQLTGSIPPSLSNLTLLKLLSFYFNQLTGSIPASLSNLSQLAGLLLDNNTLTGSIPSSLCNHLTYASIDCGEIICTCCECV